MSHLPANRYLFHWLATEKLVEFSASGLLKPYWRHFILEEGRFVKGISFCEEPMLWHPDDELPREPCLIVDREKIDCPVHFIASSEEYHLTKQVLRARRKKEDIGEILAFNQDARSRTVCHPDEAFVEGSISLDWVVAVGFQTNGEANDRFAQDAAIRFAEQHDLPKLDMSDWEIGYPGVRELDDIIEELTVSQVQPVY